MVLRALIFVFILMSSNSFANKANVRKLKLFRSKIIRVLKRTPYYKPKLNYNRFMKYAKKIKRKRKINKMTAAGFLNLAKIDTYLYVKTRNKAYKTEAMKALYVPYLFNYKKRSALSLSKKIVKLDKLLNKKKKRKRKPINIVGKVKKKKKKPKAKKKKRKGPKKIKKIALTKRLGIYSNFVSWQEDRTGTTSSGQLLIYSQFRGLCSGASYDFVFNNIAFRGHGCVVFPGKVDAKADGSSAYDEQGLASLGLMTGVGINYMVLPDQFNLIFSTELLMRQTDWEEPSGLEIDNATMMTIGFSLGAEIMRDKYSYEVKMGYGLAFPTIYWSFGVKYYLF